MNNRKIGKLVLALAGIILVGTGVAFNAAAALGNDPVGIVYDGIRSAAHLSAQQLGMASNVVNLVLVCVIFFLGRRYVNIGHLFTSCHMGRSLIWAVLSIAACRLDSR